MTTTRLLLTVCALVSFAALASCSPGEADPAAGAATSAVSQAIFDCRAPTQRLTCAEPSDPRRRFVCHPTGSRRHPYVKISVSTRSSHDHGHHDGRGRDDDDDRGHHCAADESPGASATDVGSSGGLDCDCNERQCRTVCTGATTGATCDDGDPCTGDGTCSRGVCRPGLANCHAGSAIDACNIESGTCDRATGECRTTPASSGTACEGGNVCDGTGTCVQCVTAATCPGVDTACSARSCTLGACGIALAPAGSACGGGNVCNGAGACVQCLTASACPGVDSECAARTCIAGTCGTSFAAAGTHCADGNVCDGAGASVQCLVASACPGVDNECAARTCIAGTCGTSFASEGTHCASGNVCDGRGRAVQCLAADACPGIDNVCGARTCVDGACGMSFTAAGVGCGTGLVCNGAGGCVGVARVVINEVESNGGVPGDWVELFNAGTATADLSGWIFKDNDDTHGYAIPAGTTLAVGAHMTLEEAAFGFGLGGADSARLFDRSGAIVDSYSWTTHAVTTYGRCPTGSGPLRTNTTVTKGAVNDCSVTVRINEVESSGGTPGDWAELFNPGPIAVDLSGWIFRDNDDTHAYVIPAGTTLTAGGYLSLEEAAFGFGLGAADSARLYDASGALVDSYAWTTHAVTTYGRCPNGTGAFRATNSSTKGVANDCTIAIMINEVESSGGTPGDWVELFNAGVSSVDVSGWIFRDNDDTHAYLLPAGTVLAPGAYFMLDEASFVFGLGSADSARIFDAAGGLIDSYSWTSHATITYGRCPNGTGAFGTTTTSTRGVANDCGAPPPPAGFTWPGSNNVTTVDGSDVFGTNLSDLFYEPATATTPNVLWAVRNGPSTLFRLVWNGTIWAPEALNGWDAGKTIRYGSGLGGPDGEGVTRAEPGSSAIYVATERDNDVSSVSRPSILRFDADQVGTELTATHEWNLVSDLPVCGANLGLEAITWIPDAFLVANHFFDESAGHSYNPAEYANHGSGLFFVGLEANGTVYAYALDHVVSGGFRRIASFASGNAVIKSLSFDRETGYLWAQCGAGCGNQSRVLTVDTNTASPTFGRFGVQRQFLSPSTMPNIGNEGFTIAPESQCVSGFKSVFWTDDGATGGHSLRADTIACGRFIP